MPASTESTESTANAPAHPARFPRFARKEVRYADGRTRAKVVSRRLARDLTLRLMQAVLVALSVGGALAFALQMATWPDHPLADMTHVLGWVRGIRDHGQELAYAGTYPESYMIYPPGMTYAYQAALWLAEHVAPPLWLPGLPADLPAEEWLRVCVKLVPVLGHGALALALFGGVAAAGGFWRGWLAATLYAWNPGPLFDAAYWGQGDSLNIAMLALAIAVLFWLPGWWPLRRAGGWRWAPQLAAPLAGLGAGALIAAAGLTKPQSWVFLPILAWVLLRRTGLLGAAAAVAGGAATALAIVQPWVRAGRLDEMMTVFTNVTQVMPSVSANAHNLWWLKLPGVALAVFDTTPVGGFGEWVAPPLVNHATVGRIGFVLLAMLPLLRLTGPITLRLVMACAAYTSAAYFMTITQVHENHMFAAIPFLAAAAALDAWFVLPFLVASVCVFFNMALHDFLTGDYVAAQVALHLGSRWPQLPLQEPLAIQTANARLNVANFGLLTLLLLFRPSVPRQSARALAWRARFVLAVGLAVAGGALGAVRAVIERPELAEQLWQRLAERALHSGPVEAHLGHKTPPDVLLQRAALELANGLYLVAGIAAAVGSMAALAALWWSLCAHVARWRERRAAAKAA
jgi:hypothetical protein